MKLKEIYAEDVESATKKILDYLQRDGNENVIYFGGWSGFGVTPVLRSIARVLASSTEDLLPEVLFDRVIYIDCSAWKSRRVMQRKIADELKLDTGVMALFDKQDEEDDYNCVDNSSRDVLTSVAAVIYRTLRDGKSIFVFLNGSDEEIDVNKLGIPLADYLNNKMIWSYSRRVLVMNPYTIDYSKLKYTQCYIKYGFQVTRLGISGFLHEEAASIAARNLCTRDIDLRLVTDCCSYKLFLLYCVWSHSGFSWGTHASNFFVCDGIIHGDTARDISNVLDQEIRWECDHEILHQLKMDLMYYAKKPFLVAKDDDYPIKDTGNYGWVAVTLKNPKKLMGMQNILARASSFFLALESYDKPSGIPCDSFKHCNNLGVLVLSYCAFSFTSPPFIECCTLRFLGLERCIDDSTRDGKQYTKWACLHSLRVLDIRHTDLGEILSEPKMDLMASLAELNIEGAWCWQFAGQLERRLPHLHKLRILKPMHHADTSRDISNSFTDKTTLELLDLSGNTDMKKLPTSLIKAINLQVIILDGCDELESVVASRELPSSLKSFSFDGNGPMSQWEPTIDLPPTSSRPTRSRRKSSRPTHFSKANKQGVKISKISLQGCTQLENLFLRGLSNIVEIDLSGTRIKTLDFVTMVVDVPGLKRLFLVCCEYLRAIKWPSSDERKKLHMKLELLCIDTRPGWSHGCARPILEHHKSIRFQLHAILVDARLARSLWHPMPDPDRYSTDWRLNIHITSSAVSLGDVQLGASSSVETVDLSDQQHSAIHGNQYGDLYFESSHATAPMQTFPQPPDPRLDSHIEIGDDGMGSVKSEMEEYGINNFATLMRWHARSLHVHDVSAISSMLGGSWHNLRSCRIERCPSLDPVFPPDTLFLELETLWASDLPMARHFCNWDKRYTYSANTGHNFKWAGQIVRFLHLRCCPRLQFVLPLPSYYQFPILKKLDIIHCDNLRHVFVLAENDKAATVLFSMLTTIHLCDLPKLQQICEGKMVAPVLETIKIRGCFALRRLPAVAARKPDVKKPTIEIEKDVWDSLEWDGLAAGHHPDLYEAPVHSRHYRKSGLPRGTVLR